MDVLFKKHQWLLLNLVNTPFGREFLNIPRDKQKILKFTPNSYHKLIKKDKDILTLKADFKTYDIYTEKLGLALTTYDLVSGKIIGFRDALEVFGRIVSGKYTGVLHTVTPFTANTGEGRLDRGNDVVFLDARNATTANGAGAAGVGCYSATGFYLVRGYMPFDTSSITADATITAGANTIALYRDDSQDGSGFTNADSTRVELIQTTQASNTALVAGDYDNIAFTSGGNFTLASTTNATLKTLTLNSTADTWISKTAHTKLGIITGRDFDAAAPTGSNSIWFQDRADTNKPTLSVTYTLAATASESSYSFFL